ncbi:hypothetical protein S83_066805, partial [Arachis hypogaea]
FDKIINKEIPLNVVYEDDKECSIKSFEIGPLPSDALSWYQAPFDLEGLLRTRVRILYWMIPTSFLVAFGFALDLF